VELVSYPHQKYSSSLAPSTSSVKFNLKTSSHLDSVLTACGAGTHMKVPRTYIL